VTAVALFEHLAQTLAERSVALTVHTGVVAVTAAHLVAALATVHTIGSQTPVAIHASSAVAQVP